jgi:hypothetical protein
MGAPRRRRALLRGESRAAGGRRRAVLAEAESPRCALRAFFHTFRVAAASLRARLASRFASLTRLRARLSSSLAIRRRCLATSACSLARSSGSPGALAPGAAPEPAASAPSLAPGAGAPATRFSRTVLPMRSGGWWERGDECHTNGAGLASSNGQGRARAARGQIGRRRRRLGGALSARAQAASLR